MKKAGIAIHAGFTLIELIIAIALSSIVSVVLINALYQMSRFRMMVDERVYVYSHAAIIQQQMERDITSAFIPDLIKTSTKSQEQAGTNQAGGDKKAGESDSEKSNTQKQETNSVEQGESEQKKFFYGVKSAENFELLTCITTSPLPVYWGTKSGSPRARIARVLYRLQRDSERPDSYILYRQEGAQLDFASYQESGARNFVLAKDIKSMTVTYEAEIRKKESEQDKKSLAGTAPAGAQAAGAAQNTQKSEQESTPEYKLFPEWDSDKLTTPRYTRSAMHSGRTAMAGTADSAQSLATEDLAKSQSDGGDQESGSDAEKSGVSSRTPHRVIIELRLWNPEHTQDRLFKFVYSVVWQDTKNKASSAASTSSAGQVAEQASAGTGSPGASAPNTASGAAPTAVGAKVSSNNSSARKSTGNITRVPFDENVQRATNQPATDMLVHVVTESLEIVGLI
jgi:prepilin-type N-terminal cleavage/methylation domain-containing protein